MINLLSGCTNRNQRIAADCGFYYFCGNLEKQPCPIGTVFNKDIGLCDYPFNVPECKNYYAEPPPAGEYM